MHQTLMDLEKLKFTGKAIENITKRANLAQIVKTIPEPTQLAFKKIGSLNTLELVKKEEKPDDSQNEKEIEFE